MSRPSVVTFYSYKGGVGRSFVLANVAAMLARWGFRVLCVDFDLEAPGLWHYFRERREDAGPKRGIVDLVLDADAGPESWRECLRPIRRRDSEGAEFRGALDLLVAGNDTSPDYGGKLARLDWERLYQEDHLGHGLEDWRAGWLRDYDLVLLDSRTGLTDAGGITTAQLADVLVFAFAPNRQGLDGSRRAVEKARELRQHLPIERAPFLELPLPTRFDDAALGTVRESWLTDCRRELASHYEQWCDKDVKPADLLDLLRVPYKSRWSFGEPLAVLRERATEPDTVSYAIATLAAFLARRLEDSAELVRSRDDYVRGVEERNRAVVGRGAGQQFRHQVFLSFRGDRPRLAHELRAELERQRPDASVFMAEQDLAAGTDWLDHLRTSIRSTQHMVVLAGEELSPWQQAEVFPFLLDVGRDNPERRCLPVWLRGVEPYGELARLQGIAARDFTTAELASRIWQALGVVRQELTPVDAAAAQAPLFEPSRDYLQAVRDAHQRLIPFFPEDDERLLDAVFVELELREEIGRSKRGEDCDGEAVELPEGRTSLRELLLPTPAGSSAPRWAIVGEPGAGKSTLARNLARTLAAEGRVAIYVSLGRLGNAPLEPCAIAAQEACRKHPEHVAELTTWLRERVAAGEAVLLFDGLDELAPERIADVAQRIVAFAEQDYPRAPIAVLSRPIALERRELGRRFRRAQVVHLDAARRRELLENLLGDDAEAVAAQVEAVESLRDLCANPLMLTLTALVARDSLLGAEPLPNYRGRLYGKAIELLLRRGHCAEPRGVRDVLAARQVLRELSLRLHEQGGEAWLREELSEQVWGLRRGDEEITFRLKETWATNEVFLDDIGKNAGVLGPHDGPNAAWRYLHRSLREFLAAEALRERPEELEQRIAVWVEELEKHQRERRRGPDELADAAKGPDPERWGEVYSLLCGLVDQPFDVLTVIRAKSPQLALRTLLSVESMPAGPGLAFLLDTSGWQPEQFLRCVRQWGVAAEAAGGILLGRLERIAAEDGLERLDELGRIWWTLESLGVAPSRDEFCQQAGLPQERPELDWRQIPAGRFIMGSASGDSDEQPAHEVSVPSLRLAATPLTGAQLARLLGGDQQNTSDLPAVGLSWWAARAICVWLGDDVRLPSEAEWEYACRAGTTTEYWSGDSERDLARVGWYDRNSGGRLHAVAEKEANPWGLYDMHGNVWEWCEDSWHSNYHDAPDDGSAWVDEGSPRRVVRGGSFLYVAGGCRSASRRYGPPGFRSVDQGLRPASSSLRHLTPSPPPESPER